MHLRSITFHPEEYPSADQYPFNLALLRETRTIVFDSPVSLFCGENGTGKSTVLEAVAQKCGIHIWRDTERRRFRYNPYEDKLARYVSVEWVDGPVPGSFFGSSVFQDFARILDEWASASPALLDYFGGSSLLTQSHGQSIMSFFRSRYRIKGLYLLDEPETALSPRTQIDLVSLVAGMGRKGHAQFIIATHSPIILACPGATIYSLDRAPVERVEYEDTDHYRVYRGFLTDREKYLE
ncbi:MAG TPA: AAA family ATPase [Syntrophorhabdales bacterium]|nr:AAA family ATPase [Syntrophorhabdales bacterium]